MNTISPTVTQNLMQQQNLYAAADKPIVQSVPTASVESSSFEEISMSFSESVERNSKSREERLVRPRHRMKVEQMKALYELLGHGANHAHEESVRKLLQLAEKNPRLGLNDLLELAEQDPAKADILLQLAKNRAKPENQQKLQSVTQELHQRHGVEVSAGINTAAAIAQFSKDSGQRQQLRNLYYQTIMGQASYGAVFDALLKEHDEHHFVHGLHTLIGALNEDMASQFPSMSKKQLQTVMRDLTACQHLTNILHGCRELLNSLVAKGFQQMMTATRLTHRLVQFTQANIYPREIKTLNTDVMGANAGLSVQLMFMNKLYRMLDQMPAVIWKEDKMRQSTMSLIKRVMGESAELERNQQQQGQVGGQKTETEQLLQAQFTG